MCAELGTSKEKTSIIKGQHSYETLLGLLDKYLPFNKRNDIDLLRNIYYVLNV